MVYDTRRILNLYCMESSRKSVSNTSNASRIILIILSLVIIGGAWFLYQRDPLEKTPSSTFLYREVASSPEKGKPSQVHYNSFEDYVKLLQEPATSTQYYVKVAPPGFSRISSGTLDRGIPLGLDGIEAKVFVLAPLDWQTKGKTVQEFYLEIIAPPDCIFEEECTDPPSASWYGPFEGNLLLLFQNFSDKKNPAGQ